MTGDAMPLRGFWDDPRVRAEARRFAETVARAATGRRHERHDHHERHGHHGGPRGFGPGPFAGGRGFTFGGGFFGGGPRRGRGDIRTAILALLSEEPMHGYQVIQELAERSGGAWRPSPGSVYPTLQQLEDEDLVRAVQHESGRRVFELTDAGRKEAAAAAAAGRVPWADAAGAEDGDLRGLRDLAIQVAGAVMQVARTGTPRQRAGAQEVLRDTRRRLYLLLADDMPEPVNADVEDETAG